MTKRIIVTGQFVGFHKWPEAPDEVSYLRELHRHIFHYRVEFLVDHNQRQREFHIEKENIARHIWQIGELTDTQNWSCETWAEHLMNTSKADAVEIWEDQENGARIEK